jgi:hypothetical protein
VLRNLTHATATSTGCDKFVRSQAPFHSLVGLVAAPEGNWRGKPAFHSILMRRLEVADGP